MDVVGVILHYAAPVPVPSVSVGALLLDEDFSTQSSLNSSLWLPYWFTDGNAMDNTDITPPTSRCPAAR